MRPIFLAPSGVRADVSGNRDDAIGAPSGVAVQAGAEANPSAPVHGIIVDGVHLDAMAPRMVPGKLSDQGGGGFQGGDWFLLTEPGLPANTAWFDYDLVQGLLGSQSFQTAMRQYGAAMPAYGGYWEKARPAVTLRSPSDFETYLMSTQLGRRNRLLIYVTPTPPDSPGWHYGIDYCAYHSVLPDGSPYAIVPWPTVRGCWGDSPLLGHHMVLGHELAEMLTDPYLNGWYGAQGESDDFAPCLWTPVAVTGQSGTGYQTQSFWRDDLGRCWAPSDAA